MHASSHLVLSLLVQIGYAASCESLLSQVGFVPRAFDVRFKLFAAAREWLAEAGVSLLNEGSMSSSVHESLYKLRTSNELYSLWPRFGLYLLLESSPYFGSPR